MRISVIGIRQETLHKVLRCPLLGPRLLPVTGGCGEEEANIVNGVLHHSFRRIAVHTEHVQSGVESLVVGHDEDRGEEDNNEHGDHHQDDHTVEALDEGKI